jgi:hypothetical protein
VFRIVFLENTCPLLNSTLQVLVSRTDFRPKRTLLIAFGHDEEVSGMGGAHAIVRLLQERHVRYLC